MNKLGRPLSPGYELRPSPKIRVMNADEEALIKVMTPRDRAGAMIGDPGKMRVIIQCVNALNRQAEEHGMGLWRLSSEFQAKIDEALNGTL
jgi:hypothetical protein